MMKRNVAFVISSLKRGGGAERVASMLASALNDETITVHLITFYNEDDEYSFEGTRICFNETAKESAIKKLFRRAKRIADYCREHKISSVISFMEEANFPVSLSQRYRNGAKMIVSVRQDPRVYTGMYTWLMRWLYPKASYVVAVSKKIQQDLETQFNLKNVTTIYNPYDATMVKKMLDQLLPEKYEKIFKKKFTFISVGRLAFQKGQWFLIRAFAEVVKKHPDAQLVILGEGDLRHELEDLVHSLGLEKSIHLLGNQENIYPFLKASDCFVFPSLWEGFPNTMIEALAANLPVISTDCPTGPREILEPSLGVTQPITYPYSGKYGILIGCLPRRSIQDLPLALLPEEQVLAETMERIISEAALRHNYSHGVERLTSLSLMETANQWKSLIN